MSTRKPTIAKTPISPAPIAGAGGAPGTSATNGTGPTDGVKRVLIIDDSASVTETLTDFFKTFRHRHAYEVATAADGADGFIKAMASTPDLVVVDLVMPRMGGLEFIRQLRAAGEKVPVIVITGNASAKEAAGALAQEIFSFVPKPVDFAYLEHLVALALNLPAGR